MKYFIVDVNECLTLRCATGSTCVDQINKRHCSCQPGFSGMDCSNGHILILFLVK